MIQLQIVQLQSFRVQGGRGSKKAKNLRAHYMDDPLGHFNLP